MSRPRIVIDNSVVLAWGLGEDSDYAERIIAMLEDADALAPGIWPLELANGLAVAERRGRITEAQLLQFRDLAAALPIVVQVQPVERILSDVLMLARAHRLSAYDAAYLELAVREGGALATLDAPLRKAAVAAGVAIAGAA